MPYELGRMAGLLPLGVVLLEVLPELDAQASAEGDDLERRRVQVRGTTIAAELPGRQLHPMRPCRMSRLDCPTTYAVIC